MKNSISKSRIEILYLPHKVITMENKVFKSEVCNQRKLRLNFTQVVEIYSKNFLVKFWNHTASFTTNFKETIIVRKINQFPLTK